MVCLSTVDTSFTVNLQQNWTIEEENFLFDMSSWRFILIQLHLITRETQNKINMANKIIIMVMGYTFLLSQTDILWQ